MGDGTSTNDRAATPRTPDAGGRRSRLMRWLPLMALAAGFVLFFVLGLDTYLSFDALEENQAWLERQVAENAALTAIAFMLVYGLVAAFSIPGGAFLTILGGFLFGTVLGSIYVVTGATLGAIAVFLAARTALGDALRRRAGASIERMRAGFQENALNYLLFLRLIPIFPFWLVNLVPAFLGVPLRTYAIGTFIGIAPGSVVYASVGNGVGKLIAQGERPDLGIIFEPAILGPIIGLAVLSMLPVAYKKYRAWRAARG